MIWQKKKTGVVFLREDNEFKEFIEKVKNFSESVGGEPREELDKKISLWEAGCKGEDDTKYHLQYGRTDMYVLRDIYLKTGDISAQIDYLLITRKYVYVLECKNWTGTVVMDKTGRFFKSNESSSSEPVASPVVQSDQHLKVVETIGEKFGEKLNSRYKSLVIFTNNKIRLYTESARIVCLEQLNIRLQKDEKLSSLKSFSDREMKKIAEFFLEQQTASSYYAEKYGELEKKYPKQTEEEILRQKENEIARQKEAENEILRQALQRFRKIASETEKIPPYYVMNNLEIEELLKKRPHTNEELLEVKGFGNKKVAKYGNIILNIFNR